MKKRFSLSGLLVAAGMVSGSVFGAEVGTGVAVEVAPATDTVRIVTDRRRDEIVSKVYKLKHADASELRPFLLGVVRSVPRGFPPGTVEAVRYNDGTSALIVSAPAYKFAGSKEGEGIDAIVRSLDRPAANSGTVSETEVYRPRYRSAASLAEVARRMRSFPGDRVAVDREANLLVIKGSPSGRKVIVDLLDQADRPAPQVYIRYAVYRLNEGDLTKLGNDYQSWKNGPGASFFAAGAGPGTTFVSFNPQWSSRYFDFLRSENRIVRSVSGGFLAVNGRPVGFKAGEGGGLRISLTPRIFADTVSLGVNASGRTAPQAEEWRFNTAVTVAREGGSVVIGGPETASRVESSSGVPGLRDLPGIGVLFGSRTVSEVKSRLVLVISCSGSAGVDAEHRRMIDDIESEFKKQDW